MHDIGIILIPLFVVMESGDVLARSWSRMGWEWSGKSGRLTGRMKESSR
jgi:hypothetical protein